MNIKDKLQRIDKDHLQLLEDIGKVAKEEKLKAYLVGGMVRDLLLSFDNLDIDIVVESDSLKLADALVRRFSNCKLSAKHDRFHTAKLIFDIGKKKIPVDLASTREEIYEHPAALPKVSVSELKKDLIRRDFTINALAVSLLPEDFGEIVDLFNGLSDLKNKKIKILHDKSFIDDPTRMIRAIRFACKLGFGIEDNTNNLLKETMDSKQFDNLIEKIRGDRVKIEIRYLFNLPNIEEAVNQFFTSSVYRMTHIDLKPCAYEPTHLRAYEPKNQWLIVLAMLLTDLEESVQEKIMKNLQLSGEEAKTIQDAYLASKKLAALDQANSITVFKILNKLSAESIATVSLLSSKKQLIYEFIEKTSKIKLEITGQDLINIGVKEGKAVGQVLEKILEKKITNPKMTKEDELKEAKSLISTL